MQRVSVFRRLLKDQGAGVLIEFAFALPILLILFFGVYEISRFVLVRERLESSATQMLDILTQTTNVTATSLDNLYATLPVMMQPYTVVNPRIIITQIVKPGAACKPIALWQYSSGGSRLAPTVGGEVHLDQIELETGDNAMTIEVFADYVPLVEVPAAYRLFGSFTQYVVSYGHTRYGSFNIDPNTGTVAVAECIE